MGVPYDGWAQTYCGLTMAGACAKHRPRYWSQTLWGTMGNLSPLLSNIWWNSLILMKLNLLKFVSFTSSHHILILCPIPMNLNRKFIHCKWKSDLMNFIKTTEFHQMFDPLPCPDCVGRQLNHGMKFNYLRFELSPLIWFSFTSIVKTLFPPSTRPLIGPGVSDWSSFLSLKGVAASCKNLVSNWAHNEIPYCVP